MARILDTIRRRKLATIALVAAAAAIFPITGVGCSVIGMGGWEERAYTAVVEDGRFEIRDYEPAILATATSDGTFGSASGEAFGELGGYIFGKNAEEASIAMTVPVQRVPVGAPRIEVLDGDANATTAADEAWEMGFYMPREWSMASLPEPTSDAVTIREIPGETMAVYRYSGVQRGSDLEKYAGDLLDWIDANGYLPAGEAELAAFDPPWTLWFLRRNEVQVPVRKVGQ
ncbi:MAG: heme-binding protein [Planctomycetota bacterium]